MLTHQPLDVDRLQCEALGADGFHDKVTDIHRIVEPARQWVTEEPDRSIAQADAAPALVAPLLAAMAFCDAVTAPRNSSCSPKKTA